MSKRQSHKNQEGRQIQSSYQHQPILFDKKEQQAQINHLEKQFQGLNVNTGKYNYEDKEKSKFVVTDEYLQQKQSRNHQFERQSHYQQQYNFNKPQYSHYPDYQSHCRRGRNHGQGQRRHHHDRGQWRGRGHGHHFRGFPPFHQNNYVQGHPFASNNYQGQMRPPVPIYKTEQSKYEDLSQEVYQDRQGWKDKHYESKGRKNKCWERGKMHHHRHHHKRSKSRSQSGNSSSTSNSISNSKQKKSFKSQEKKERKKQIEECWKQYEQQLNGFFEQKQISERQRFKIIKVLIKSFPLYSAPIDHLIESLKVVEQQNLTLYMAYCKIVKTIIKQAFDFDTIIPKLRTCQYHKMKRFEADQQYLRNHGQKESTPLLEVDQLINLNSNEKKPIYLIDGNNILPTNKHFRKYFQSHDASNRVQVQIRCRWLLSHAFDKQEVILFFDQKFDEDAYNHCYSKIFFSEKERQACNQITVIYGDGQKADDKIVETTISLTQQAKNRQIVLISADRDLNMRCQQITPVLHTSGKYFFKYAKFRVFRKYKGEKELKGIIKRIISYEH